MRSTRFFPAATLALLLASSAFGKDGRDFPGFYSVSNAAVQGGQVRLTLTMQLFNYSGADVRDASISVRPGPPETATLATYAPVELWRAGADLRFTLHLTVPRAEFDRWSQRRQPTVIVINRDEQGRPTERTAQINRRPAIPLDDHNESE